MTFTRRALAILALPLLFATCSGNPEAPPDVPETVESDLGGDLPVLGEVYNEFTMNRSGLATVTLASVVLARPGPTTNVAVDVGLGTLIDGVCNTLSSVTTSAGLTSQLSAPLDQGIRCVRIKDVGNLTAPVSYTLRIIHP